MKQALFIGAIASVLTLNAYADPVTITTQDYVDTNFQTKIPAQSGYASTVITTTDTAGTVGQRGIYGGAYDRILYEEEVEDDPNVRDYLPGMYTLHTALEYISGISAARAVVNAGNRYNRLLVPTQDDSATFNYMATVNSVNDVNGAPSQFVPTMAAMTEKQNKMTCTQWVSDEHTDANCLLWDLSN